MKQKMSLEDSITLAQNNASDFTHACVTIALNEKFGIGKERQKKVNAVRDEVNGKVLETGKIKMEGEAQELANNIEVRKAYLGCE